MRTALVSLSLTLLLACAGAAPQPDRPPAAARAAPPPTAGCAVPDAPAPEVAFKVDGPTAKLLVSSGARLVDVRMPDFYAREHIAGAINIPAAQVAARAAAEIGPPDTRVVLYCRTGAGSGRAAATLKALGYKFVYDLGSYLNWGEGAPAPTPLPAAKG
jgi:rhodanese-related sulfurtransferase